MDDEVFGFSWAVDEGLRWHPSVSKQTRRAVGDKNRHGIDIPNGTVVLASILGANRDPAVFEIPTGSMSSVVHRASRPSDGVSTSVTVLAVRLRPAAWARTPRYD